jgi:hypothetical protein
VRSCNRQSRTCPLSLFKASLLIAGLNELNQLAVLTLGLALPEREPKETGSGPVSPYPQGQMSHH